MTGSFFDATTPLSPESLAGAEAVIAFVTSYFVYGREFHAVPYVPPQDHQDVRMRAGLSIARGDRGLAEERHARWLAEQARFTQFRHGPDSEDRGLQAEEILAIIESNERVEAEFAAQRVAFDRRRREYLLYR